MEKAKLEEGCSVEAGSPPTPREQWVAEVRRLLVTKYDLQWPADEIASYAESLAETFWEDGEPDETPDGAIWDDFTAGL